MHAYKSKIDYDRFTRLIPRAIKAMDAIRPKPTKEEVAKALDTFVLWFPDVAVQLQLPNNREAIICHIFNGTEPALDATETRRAVKGELKEADLPEATSCLLACTTVAVDAMMFIVGLWGIRVSRPERVPLRVISFEN